MSFYFPYPGSKYRHRKIICEKIKERTYDVYIEPCLGGGSILLELQPPNAICCDISPGVIAAFVCAGKELARVHHDIKSFEEAKKGYEKGVEIVNNKIIKSKESIYFAACFLYLTCNSYCSMILFDKKGRMNSKKSAAKPRFIKKERFTFVRNYLKNNHIEFYCCNYKELTIPPNSIIFFDPPYDKRNMYKKNDTDHESFYKDNVVMTYHKPLSDTYTELIKNKRKEFLF